ncbi:MAG: hypothetical protein A2Z77_04040 [Chloroflexi bacterium RBG_13_51_36]|nr:MAG: hypothetical protein A2Z77_04040 [Chloroflexi bacterium RBG_13_51_36]
MDSNHRPGLVRTEKSLLVLQRWQFRKSEKVSWGILAIEETSPSLKPKHPLGIVTEEQLLHVVAEFEGIKVF